MHLPFMASWPCLSMFGIPDRGITKTLRIMKLMAVFLLTLGLHAAAGGFSQKVTLKLQDVDIKKAFTELESQTDYYFAYTKATFRNAGTITVDLENVPLSVAIDLLLKDLPLSYTYKGRFIVIAPKINERTIIRLTAPPQDITGFVKDSLGNPIEGASIRLLPGNKGTSTNRHGAFSITKVPEGDYTLEISFIGYKTIRRSVSISGNTAVTFNNIVLYIQENAGEDNVVITGYNRIEKRKLTSAITELKKDDIQSNKDATLDKLLQGRVAGMMVITSSGEVGSVPIVKIRGTSTLTGNSQPLWVVDGIILEDPVPLTPAEFNSPDLVNRIGNAIRGINPADIETITVLKDASATAIYGVKAANGVVVLTTRKGKAGAMEINFNTTGNIELKPQYNRFNLMNSKERIQIEKYYLEKNVQYFNADANINSVGLSGAYARYKNRDLATWEDFEKDVRKAQTYNTDWFDILFRNSTTLTNNLSLSGGSDKSTYYASLSSLNQTGQDRFTNNNRYTGTLRLNSKLSERLNSEFFLSGYMGKRESYAYSYIPAGISTFTRPTPRPFDYAINTSRTFPLKNEDGSYYFYRGHNDFYLFNVMNEYNNSDQSTTTDNFNARLSLDFKIRHNLRAFAVLNYTTTTLLQETYYKENTNQVAGVRRSEFGVPAPEDSYLPNGGVIFTNSMLQRYYTTRLSLEYRPVQTEKHQLEIYGGGEYRVNTYRGDNTIGWGYLHDRGRTVSVSQTMGEILGGYPYLTISDYSRKYASYYGVSSYTFMNKYTINGNIRFDGSNLFGSNPTYRWKPAWSVSGRWNLGEESFMQSIPFFDMIALRGSFGVQGSTNEQNTPQIVASFLPPSYWSEVNLLNIQQPANPDLRWEKTTNTNLGLDYSLAKNNISISLDVYKRKSIDLIVNTRISEVNGYSYLPINFADVTNSGIELGLSVTSISNKNFSLTTAINLAHNKNRVDRVNLEPNFSRMLAADPNKPDAAIQNKPLSALYSVKYGYLDNTGAAHFLLANGDTTKAITGINFTVADAIYSGTLIAPYEGGINNTLKYKNFDCSIFFTYAFNNVLRLDEILSNQMYAPDQNLSKDLLNAFVNPGDENKPGSMPNIIVNQTGANNHKQFWNKSDIRVGNASYLRLKSVSVRYNLPKTWLNSKKLGKTYLQLEGNNLLLIADKRLNGFDPETFVYKSYPLLPSFLFSVNITF